MPPKKSVAKAETKVESVEPKVEIKPVVPAPVVEADPVDIGSAYSEFTAKLTAARAGWPA